MNSERYGKLVGDAINSCLTTRECKLIALQEFISRSVYMLHFVYCKGNLNFKAFKAFLSNILPPGTYFHKQQEKAIKSK